MAKYTGFIITAGHLDIEWYEPMRSYRFWTIQALKDLKQAAQREDFVTYVLDGQVFPLEEYLEVYPQDTEEMKALVKAGKLSIGPFYTQFDEWLPSAENMIRNCLYGKRKAQAYGGYMAAGYLPDNFGHPRQIPQILRNFGIDSLLFERGMPEVPGGHPDEFIYRGLDGSKVYVSHFREGYSGAFDIFKKPVEPKQPRAVPYYDDYISFEYHRSIAWHDDPGGTARNLIENVHKIKDRYPSRVIPLIAGADHLPPQINVGDSVRAANEMQDEIEFVMGSAEDYIREMQKRTPPMCEYDMELVGARYHYILFGALSTRSYLKRQNFAGEALLEKYAEPLIALSSAYGYQNNPLLMDEAWRMLLINSAHDSIHGSSVDEVHVEMEARYAAARQIAAGMIHDAMSHLTCQLTPWWKNKGRGILAYAPVGAPFAQPCETWVALDGEQYVVRDEKGAPLPTQVLPREKIEKNSIGKDRNDPFPDAAFRKVLYLQPFTEPAVSHTVSVEKGSCALEPLAAGENFLDNGLVRVEVQDAYLNILDYATGWTFRHLNMLEEEADAGDAWDFSPPWLAGEMVRSAHFTCNLVEQGPVRAALKIQGVMNVPACLEGDIRSQRRLDMAVSFLVTVYRGIRRVDIQATIDNTARDHRIRLYVPLRLKTNTILSQGDLAIICRPIKPKETTEAWRQPPTLFYPCREWVAAHDAVKGLAVAVKGMYDYESTVNSLTGEAELRFTLLRGFQKMGRLNTFQREGPASDANDTPGAQCLGVQTMEWAYVPYTPTSDDQAPFLAETDSFLYPPVTHAVRHEEERNETLAGIALPFAWEEKNLCFSAFKKCQDDECYVLRFFENQGKALDTHIRLPLAKKAWLSNMNEDTLEEVPLEKHCVKVHVCAYQAVTIKWQK